MLKLNLMTTKFIALFVATQFLAIMFFANFHLGMSEHDFGEKPHFHISMNMDDHHLQVNQDNSEFSETMLQEHGQTSEIYVHLNLIDTTPSSHVLLNLHSSKTFLFFKTDINSFGQPPLLPPPTV